MRNNPLPAVFRRPGRPAVSVEFFPPKDEAAGERMLEVARILHGTGVDFASITYGAGGSSRDTTLAYGRKLVAMGYAMVGHLTCVGHSRRELAELVARYDEAGFSGILALRGDPPKGQGAFVRHPEGFAHAHELVRLIQAERPGRFSVSVAGFPERHPDSPDDLSDVRHLAGKVAAGADFVTTQLFLDNADYFRFVARASAAGVRVPIVPGIMPVLSLRQARSFCGFCKARIPAALERELEACGEDEEAQRRVGVRWAVAQARGLVAAGAPGLHVYVLNRSDSARELFAALRS